MVTGEQPLYDEVAFKIPFRGNVDELYVEFPIQKILGRGSV